jgi:hypothetical protein
MRHRTGEAIKTWVVCSGAITTKFRFDCFGDHRSEIGTFLQTNTAFAIARLGMRPYLALLPCFCATDLDVVLELTVIDGKFPSFFLGVVSSCYFFLNGHGRNGSSRHGRHGRKELGSSGLSAKRLVPTGQYLR